VEDQPEQREPARGEKTQPQPQLAVQEASQDEQEAHADEQSGQQQEEVLLELKEGVLEQHAQQTEAPSSAKQQEVPRDELCSGDAGSPIAAEVVEDAMSGRIACFPMQQVAADLVSQWLSHSVDLSVRFACSPALVGRAQHLVDDVYAEDFAEIVYDESDVEDSLDWAQAPADLQTVLSQREAFAESSSEQLNHVAEDRRVQDEVQREALEICCRGAQEVAQKQEEEAQHAEQQGSLQESDEVQDLQTVPAASVASDMGSAADDNFPRQECESEPASETRVSHEVAVADDSDVAFEGVTDEVEPEPESEDVEVSASLQPDIETPLLAAPGSDYGIQCGGVPTIQKTSSPIGGTSAVVEVADVEEDEPPEQRLQSPSTAPPGEPLCQSSEAPLVLSELPSATAIGEPLPQAPPAACHQAFAADAEDRLWEQATLQTLLGSLDLSLETAFAPLDLSLDFLNDLDFGFSSRTTTKPSAAGAAFQEAVIDVATVDADGDGEKAPEAAEAAVVVAKAAAAEAPEEPAAAKAVAATTEPAAEEAGAPKTAEPEPEPKRLFVEDLQTLWTADLDWQSWRTIADVLTEKQWASTDASASKRAVAPTAVAAAPPADSGGSWVRDRWAALKPTPTPGSPRQGSRPSSATLHRSAAAVQRPSSAAGGSRPSCRADFVGLVSAGALQSKLADLRGEEPPVQEPQLSVPTLALVATLPPSPDFDPPTLAHKHQEWQHHPCSPRLMQLVTHIAA